MDTNKASKILAEYMGLVYVAFNDLGEFPKPGYWEVKSLELFQQKSEQVFQMNIDTIIALSTVKNGWVRVGEDKQAKYVSRSSLPYFYSYDELFKIVAKLEKEDGIKIARAFHGWEAYVYKHTLDFKPIGVTKYTELPDREQLFWNLVDAVKYIKELKNGEDKDT